MGRGIIESGLFRTERVELEQRTSDPSSPEPGEEWLRVDQKPSYEDADGNTQTGVAEYRRVNADGTTQTAPVAQLGHSVGENVIDKVRPYVDAGGSPTGKGFLPFATTGAAYPDKQLEHPTDGRAALHDALTAEDALPDSVVSREDDNNSTDGGSGESGVIFESTEVLSGEISGEISSNTVGATQAVVKRQSDGAVFGSTDISTLSAGELFTIGLSSPLQANTEYRMVVDGSSYTRGYHAIASYPYTSEDGVLSLVTGWSGGRQSGYSYSINHVGPR